MNEVIDEPKTTTSLAMPMEVDLSKLSPEQIDDRVAAIERAAGAKQRMIRAATKLCYPQDWINFGTKPYLTGGGAMRLCAVGINLSEPKFDVDEQGEDIFVTCTIEAEWPAMAQRSVQTGACNTRDKFFSGSKDGSFYNQCLRNAEGETRLARKMMLGHIRKKAQENATSRAVCAVMGIKDLTWEDLEAVGFSRDKAGGDIEFKKGATAKSRAETTSQPPSNVMSEVIALPVGSICTTSGVISRVEEKKKKDGEAYFRISFEGGPIANYWNANPAEWVRVGEKVIVTIKVGKYGDGKNYQIDHMELDEGSNEPS